MIGSILYQDLLVSGRRNRLHYLRWIYAGWLVLVLIGLVIQFAVEEANIAQTRLAGGPDLDRHASMTQIVGARFAEFFVWQQSLFLLLFTPVFTAGALVDEKRQGTLQYLLLSDTEPRQIVLGKLLGRLIQTGLWLLAGWPLFALMAGFAGLEPMTLLLFGLGQLPLVYAVASLSLLASSLCRQTRDAVLLVYFLLVVGAMAAGGLGGILLYLDPLWTLETTWGPPGANDWSESWRRLSVATLLWSGLGSVALIVASWRLGPSYARELEAAGKDRLRWARFERPPIGDQPIRWREQLVEGLAINATFRQIPTWVMVILVALLSTFLSLVVLNMSMAPGTTLLDVAETIWAFHIRQLNALTPHASEGFLLQGLVVMLLASLVVGVRCAGAISQERERQTWEALLLSPMTARQIVHGKLSGIMRASLPYLLAYAVPAVCLSILGGMLALVYTLCWLGATVLAMYFIGATGLWCSVPRKNSWKSLIQTVLVGYLSALAVYTVTFPATAVLAVMLWLFLLSVRMVFRILPLGQIPILSLNYYWLLSVASALGLIVIFWLLARLFLYRTVRWIADRDRVRFRVEAPLYHRTRLQAR